MNIERVSPAAPAFRVLGGGRSFFYAPGHLSASHSKAAERIAQSAIEEWERRRSEPFSPECLTVNVTDKCNLTCSYCFSKPARGPAVVSEQAVRAATRLVADACARKRKPFHLVLHGGGEPTIEWDLLQSISAITKNAAADRGLEWFGYVATNGTLPQHRAGLLAREFSLIGLSCDGPPWIQGHLRTFGDGRPSFEQARNTAQTILAAGGRLSVRATIIPQAMHRQRDLVVWLHENLHATDLRFEPAYSAFLRSPAAFKAEDAPAFVHHFLDAQQEARLRECNLRMSGVRLDELHAAHCNPLRDVLQLMPSGHAAICSFAYDVNLPTAGRYDPDRDEIVVDHDRLRHWKNELMAIPARCANCVNILHCTRECPERCPLVPGGSFTEGGFRCQTNMLLAHAWLREATTEADRATVDAVNRELESAPPEVDRASILHGLSGALRAYPQRSREQPRPSWAERGFSDDGETAWRELARQPEARSPLSVYVHIPFCDRLCGGCDCHSIAGVTPGEERAFIDRLRWDIDRWINHVPLAARPVTTVHLGGGTPTQLSPDGLQSLLTHIRRSLRTDDSTEWALETTTSRLSPAMLDMLHEMSVRRIHIGLQSLEKGPREFFGRRESARVALSRVQELLGRGFVVSVDLVYGLDGESLQGWVDGIDQLVAAGVHGLSLYQFNVTQRNGKYVTLRGADAPSGAKAFVFFQAAAQILERHGFTKNHFAHFARGADRNLYYTHASRAEDLLAVGPTADGILSSYRYRHAMSARPSGRAGEMPSLEGGRQESDAECRARLPMAELMCARIGRHRLLTAGLGPLADRWIVDGLVREQNGELLLTGTGSWFIGPMLKELADGFGQ